MKVLIPVEDPLFGSAIVRFVVNHQWPQDTVFHVVNVVEPYLTEGSEHSIPQAPMSALFAVSEKQIIHAADELTAGVASSIEKLLPEFKVQKSVIKGHITDEIISYARKHEIDLVIAGSHGRSGFQKFFLGSVSLVLAIDCPCSVLLIKPDASLLEAWSKIERYTQTDTEQSFKQLQEEVKKPEGKRILLAVDESTSSEKIIDFVMSHKWGRPTHFQLLSVIRNPHESIFPVSEALEELYADQKKVRRACMRNLALRLRDHYHSPHIEEALLEGDPKQTITEAARLWGADLIVVGSRYRRTLQRMTVGSVSMAVLSSAPCSVLLLKETVPSTAKKMELEEANLQSIR